ncbi:hypothetical protein [Corynebacterium ureicelerivorans]|uniref:hypothetical protein n=1 Tax=Corynebacterium ureicelerivorans TaxID=401472 RepID=UPI000A8D4E0F|nr:hypothetical protein [Corynebacterium ureicelerivorans]
MTNRAIIFLIIAALAALSVPVIMAGTGAILPVVYALAGLLIYELATDPYRNGDTNE